MSILIGHASISENGTVNGVKGDQTGTEVCVRTWYNKPWDFMAIHPDATVREKHAKIVEAVCANNNIGYSQNDRNSLYALAKTNGFNFSSVGKCNCDCSSLQNVAALASGAAGVSYGSNGWTTFTMESALSAAGYKIVKEREYLTNAEYCVRGAIYVNTRTHTVCGLTNGSLSKKTLQMAGITTSGGTSGGGASDTYTKKQFIRDVQSVTGAAVDGIAGPETLSKTVTVSAKTNRSHAVVKPIQKRLYAMGYTTIGAADGIAGPKFTATVNSYQKKKLWYNTVDGEITKGGKMWKSLLGM